MSAQTYDQLHARCTAAGVPDDAWGDLHADWFTAECAADPALLFEIEFYVARLLGCSIVVVRDGAAALPVYDAARHAEVRPWLGKHIDETKRAAEEAELAGGTP